jgi:hypothetical protein
MQQDSAVPWAQSDAKQILEQNILEGLVTEKSNPDIVYTEHNEYSKYDRRQFKYHLKQLLKTLTRYEKNATYANNAVANAKKNHPRNELTVRGYPFWDTSQARLLLMNDISIGLTAQLKPRELWETRKEYKEFPLDVFRQHIYQENTRRKASAYWLSRKSKKSK